MALWILKGCGNPWYLGHLCCLILKARANSLSQECLWFPVQSWSQTLQYAEGHLTQCCHGSAQRPKSISSSNLTGTKPTWCRERSWLPFPCLLTFWNEVCKVAFISKAVASLEKVSLQVSRYEKQDPHPCKQKYCYSIRHSQYAVQCLVKPTITQNTY